MDWGKLLGMVCKTIVNNYVESQSGKKVFDQDLNNYQPKTRNNGNNGGKR